MVYSVLAIDSLVLDKSTVNYYNSLPNLSISAAWAAIYYSSTSLNLNKASFKFYLTSLMRSATLATASELANLDYSAKSIKATK
jgi:hypothetical protein